jgi:LPS-assembly protein
MRAFLLLLLTLLLQLILLTGAATGQSMTLSGDQPWTLEADRIQIFQDAGVVEAWGNVTMARGEDVVSADFARYYWETQWVYLKGSVLARWRGDTMEAERAEFDLENMVGWMDEGRIFLAESNIFIAGEDLRKTGPNNYAFSRASVTSCEGDPPAWSFSSRQGEVEIDGYAKLWGTRFQIRDIPLIYSPYLVLPIKVSRQSGFLLPQFASSSRHGLSVNLPYYWAIDEERDLTLYGQYMTERGYMQGIEYRHTPNVLSQGLWRADVLYDRTTASTEAEEESQFQGDGLVRPNSERYWIRGKYTGFLRDPVWRTEIDLDWVSDQNYLREFRKGYSGFDESRDEFLDAFGRDIEEVDDLTRTSSWLVRRTWEVVELNALAAYSQNLRYMNRNLDPADDPTIQRLPEINLDLYRTRLFGTPLEIQAESQAVYFWRRFGTTATRLDVHPRIGLPVDLTYAVVTPSIGWRQTAYFVDSYEGEPDAVETDRKTRFRGLPDAHVNLFSQFNRIFEIDASPVPEEHSLGRTVLTRLKHDVQTQIDWNYIPSEDQTGYPRFDNIDRIAARNELTYALTNLFTGRRESVVRQAPGEEFRLTTSYQDLLRVRFEQSYDIRESTRDTELESFERRPFSDLITRVSYSPRGYLSLNSTTWYSFYTNRITEHEHLLRLLFGQQGSAYFGLDFLAQVDDDIRRRDQDELTILRLGGRMLLTPRWRLSLDNRYDLEEGENLETVVGLEFFHQCYALQLVYSHTPFDDRVEFRFDLKGL